MLRASKSKPGGRYHRFGRTVEFRVVKRRIIKSFYRILVGSGFSIAIYCISIKDAYSVVFFWGVK